MEFDKLENKDSGSKLCNMLTYYGEQLISGRGFEISPLQQTFTPEELVQFDADTLYALTLRKDLFFYEMFVEFDRVYRFFTERKLIKMPRTDEYMYWAKIPVEFVKLLLKNILTRREYSRYREEDFEALHRYMGNSLFMYYQGLLYEYYCDKTSHEMIEASVKALLAGFNSLNKESPCNDVLSGGTAKNDLSAEASFCWSGGFTADSINSFDLAKPTNGEYLFDEDIDCIISKDFQDMMEKVQISEKYARLMNRNLEKIRQVRKRRFHDPALDKLIKTGSTPLYDPDNKKEDGENGLH